MAKRKVPLKPSAIASLGGVARGAKLAPGRRAEIARKAALARHKATSKKQRKAAALKAITARWAKVRQQKKHSRP
jgi:hypothetical protein